MPNRDKIEAILQDLVHPETGVDIVSAGIVQNIVVKGDKISLMLSFPRSRDPFAASIKRQVEELITQKFPQYTDKLYIFTKEAAPAEPAPKQKITSTGEIQKIVAIVSGKGGVGKSTVTSNLAVELAHQGFRVGVLDADIYGPSQPKMFGVEGYEPTSVNVDGVDWIVPAQSMGVSVMSIGFFISPDDALIWRGPMATSALKQLIHQTAWGPLDFLLIDMPPGTGDVHLTIVQELKLDNAIVVTTPQQVAISDAVRAIRMLQSKDINIPILGVVENMAWFTPVELPQNRYYLFGKGGGAELAKKEKLDLLGEIPVIQSVMEGAESGKPASSTHSFVRRYYAYLVEKIVEKLV